MFRVEKRERKKIFLRILPFLESLGFGREIWSFYRFSVSGGRFCVIFIFLTILYVVFFSPLLDRGEKSWIEWEIEKKCLKIE